MKSLRNISVWLLSIALVGFAFPAFAQKSTTKYGSVNFPSLLSPSASGEITVPVTFFNSTPKPGVSTINSAWVKITNADVPNADVLDASVGVVGVEKLILGDGTVDGSVTVRDMSGALCSPTNVCKEFTITNFTGISNNQSGKFLLKLAGITKCVNILWNAEANTGNAYPGGDAFLLTKLNMSTACDGILDCESTPNGTFQFGQTGITGKRGDNKDISACVKVPYDLVDNRGSSVQRSVEFKWDYTSQPAASFEYTVPWLAELVNATTGMPNPTKLAWLDGGAYTTPVNGRACIGATLPQCLGKLAANVGSLSTTISVVNDGSCVAPPAETVPFAITVDSERMKVTAIDGTTWTVERGDGETTATAHVAVRVDGSITKVASNPLPLDDSVPPKQMQMCIKSESWQAVGVDYCTGTSGPLCSLIEVTTTVFDIGDGLMIR